MKIVESDAFRSGVGVQGLEKNIGVFNEFFGDLTKEIYGERYILIFPLMLIKAGAILIYHALRQTAMVVKKKVK